MLQIHQSFCFGKVTLSHAYLGRFTVKQLLLRAMGSSTSTLCHSLDLAASRPTWACSSKTSAGVVAQALLSKQDAARGKQVCKRPRWSYIVL